MGSIKIKRQSCKGCQLCIQSCPRGLLAREQALNLRGVHPVYFQGGECTACTFCAQVCPECCIEVFK